MSLIDRDGISTQKKSVYILQWICFLSMIVVNVNGFIPLSNSNNKIKMISRFNVNQMHFIQSKTSSSSSSSSSFSNHRVYDIQTKLKAYVPPEQSESEEQSKKKKSLVAPYPKVGDIVRYTDLDGGKMGLDGEVLVGKITFIQAVSVSVNVNDNVNVNDKDKDKDNEWLVEIVELDDVGDGYYAEFPNRERRNRKSLRKLNDIAPIPASFVRSEDAFKIPFVQTNDKMIPAVSFESYNLVGYEGPVSAKINNEIVESDGERYDELKLTLIKDAALFGAFGAIIAQFAKGTEDALIYAAGAFAGVGYLFFLSLKVSVNDMTLIYKYIYIYIYIY